MNFEDLLKGPWPDDITLGEFKSAFYNGSIAPQIAALSRFKQVRFRFMRTADDTELPDDTTLELLKWMIERKLAHIVIDDEDGGRKYGAPAPVTNPPETVS